MSRLAISLVASLVLWNPSLSAAEPADTRGITVVVAGKDQNDWQEIPVYRKTVAVIIGIDRYPKLNESQQLTYAVSDAKATEQLLKKKFKFSQVFALYNEDATKSKIEDVLLNKLADVTRDDGVFVFFAGHGGQEKTDFGDIGFIVPHDGTLDDRRTVISMTAIRDDISKRIPAKHAFFVMDCCYSGILAKTRDLKEEKPRRDPAFLKHIVAEPVRQVLTAGTAEQQVLDGGPNGHSVFTGRFLEVLNSARDFMTATEVSVAVTEKVFSDAAARQHKQTPQHGKLFGIGDFVFMPSVERQIGSIQDEIETLEAELKLLAKREAEALAAKDGAKQRAAARERQVALAKLEASRLEEARLKEDAERRQKREAEIRAMTIAQQKERNEEAERLQRLQAMIEEKRKSYKSSMAPSLEAAVAELQSLDQDIREILDQYRVELRKRIETAAKARTEQLSTTSLVKDEFETQAEFEARLAKSKSGASAGTRFAAIQSTLNTVYREQIQPLREQMIRIANQEFTLYGHDALRLQLGRYDAENERFRITIASSTLKGTLHTQHRMVKLDDVGKYDDAYKAGMRNGDILLSYNGQPIAPWTDWKRIQQTVVTDTTTVEYERSGEAHSTTIRKDGDLDDHFTSSDIYARLKPHEFVAVGHVYVPRTKARKFKQNYLNDFVSAEVRVRALSPEFTMIVAADIVDETSDERFDMYRSSWIAVGAYLLYQPERKLLWWDHGSDFSRSWIGHSEYARLLRQRKLAGWSLPHVADLQSARRSGGLSYFRKPYNGRTVATADVDSKSSQKHITFDTSDGDTSTSYKTSSSSYAALVLRIDSSATSASTSRTANSNRRSAGSTRRSSSGIPAFKPLVNLDSGPASRKTTAAKSASGMLNPYLVDDYDLFAERFLRLSLSRSIVYDCRTSLILITAPASSFTYLEAEAAARASKTAELRGWRLPSIEEASTLYNPVTCRPALSIKHAGATYSIREIRTKTLIKQGYHQTFDVTDGGRSSDSDTYKRYVVLVQ